MLSVYKTISVIKKAIKSPHWETELHIDRAVALAEVKYCDVVYDLMLWLRKGRWARPNKIRSLQTYKKRSTIPNLRPI